MQEYIEFFQANPVLSIAWVGLFAAVVVMTIKSATSKVSNVNTQELTMLMNKQGAKVVDVRSQDDYRKGHIVDAIHVPLAEIKNNKATALEKFKTSPIITVCAAGMTSSQAAQLLVAQGFENVHNLKGGMGDWQAANLPVVKGKK
ncbi:MULTISPECIES: rhodanese-like domain-containing protein [unclassified Shewanella]|uniref:rhodanese-like domain-containing protein n=1 Tax=unclassified Shewanella TaxID=196818 RepID=UPI0009710B96|nr:MULTISPECIES: rhodanese-like domain-containing protein [unclassified Shewanella]MDO6621109.1 rhodanese-like domain-containing protein [Shewanella sp. 6_MG-2023]MDO6640659.1 rhodanese-like domain-containing protein [Shewanella sp. 5_MG-2023]MDO6678791.1 rhodanese-like domain-containing protein [Shewanella sp. 4_MG-2023]PMG28026.1 rhodanese-like domain-containing protein [Shewanella sp. 10N.286.52.C2]PMG42108.1 rhodanese-like domain-containing protein [Shewanella sp. 10N.286.52.B9]